MNIEEKLSIGRKTAYSLMGAGFHSGNGLKTCLNGNIWSAFVVPRVVYGLKVLSLKKKDVETLEMFQRKSLRHIQGLPDKTPKGITLALLGILPLETIIHKNAPNLFMSISRNKHFLEHEIAERQIAMKDFEDKSWFNLIRQILDKYGLPSIFYLFEQRFFKVEWKKILSSAVHGHIEAMWRAEVNEKPSLKCVNPDSLKVGSVHPVWATVRNSITDNRRAQLKCKLLSGTYTLQGNRAAFNQYTVDATCNLRLAAPETRQHFVAECMAYSAERERYTEKIRNNPALPDELKHDLLNPELFTQLTLDASSYVSQREELENLELHSREYIDQIHRKRIVKLNQTSQCRDT